MKNNIKNIWNSLNNVRKIRRNDYGIIPPIQWYHNFNIKNKDDKIVSNEWKTRWYLVSLFTYIL